MCVWIRSVAGWLGWATVPMSLHEKLGWSKTEQAAASTSMCAGWYRSQVEPELVLAGTPKSESPQVRLPWKTWETP